MAPAAIALPLLQAHADVVRAIVFQVFAIRDAKKLRQHLGPSAKHISIDRTPSIFVINVHAINESITE